MERETYSLNINKSSESYYNDISNFTCEVLNEGAIFYKTPVEMYREYHIKSNLENIPYDKENILEFLLLGVLWKGYSSSATNIKHIRNRTLIYLHKFRRKFKNIKPLIDFFRGIMLTSYLQNSKNKELLELEPDMKNFKKLLRWLEASGEFNFEVKRLKNWFCFLSEISYEESSEIIQKAITWSAWFEDHSKKAIGKYTVNVEKYLKESYPKHYWHENVIFCGRKRVEYHLNMLGGEIMNSVYRQGFINTDDKVIVLPACMSMSYKSSCKIKKTDDGNYCSGCNPKCMVNSITQLGKENSFKVIVVPHQSSLSNSDKGTGILKENIGVVGVACVLNLISGGWMLKERNIYAQCVLLDYCGCKRHWHKEGIPTCINIEQLKKILNIKY
ncbi:UNVERIFIED_CONTAM: hypothetical protein Cloal_0480 [Acetivibrio alkalicellulosi]